MQYITKGPMYLSSYIGLLFTGHYNRNTGSNNKMYNRSYIVTLFMITKYSKTFMYMYRPGIEYCAAIKRGKADLYEMFPGIIQYQFLHRK